MATDRDVMDLLDTLIDRIDKMSPEQLADLRAKVAIIDEEFDPNKPVDGAALDNKIAAWRSREVDRLFNEK